MKSSRRYVAFAVTLAAVITVFIAAAIQWEHYQGRKLRIVYVPKVEDGANDFWISLLEGARMAAEEYDVDLTVLAPASEDDYEGQIRCVEEAIGMNPDAILLSPSSMTEITDAANDVVSAEIKLVLIDSELDENLQSALVSTDNYEAGRKMGDYAKSHLPEDPVIGIVAHVEGSSTAIEREAGFREGLGEYEDCIVETVFCDSDYDKAYRLTKEMIEQHPEINMLAGLNEYSAVGAARAVRDLGLSDTIRMIGFDSSQEEVQLLEAGVFDAIVIQKPFNMGYLGVERTVEILHGELEPTIVDSGSKLITKDNMYVEENQKLLFPFAE